jgi:hypothetical protein
MVDKTCIFSDASPLMAEHTLTGNIIEHREFRSKVWPTAATFWFISRAIIDARGCDFRPLFTGRTKRF